MKIYKKFLPWFLLFCTLFSFFYLNFCSMHQALVHIQQRSVFSSNLSCNTLQQSLASDKDKDASLKTELQLAIAKKDAKQHFCKACLMPLAVLLPDIHFTGYSRLDFIYFKPFVSAYVTRLDGFALWRRLQERGPPLLSVLYF